MPLNEVLFSFFTKYAPKPNIKLGIKTVAEGVEYKDQRNILFEFKGDYLQGFYYSRPVPENKFVKLLGRLDLHLYPKFSIRKLILLPPFEKVGVLFGR
jgi:hypothetical protein